jgi:2-methylisocitrate lyase-like PEP mutase family enzyme
VRLAIDAGLAGGSIEDFTGRDDDPIYPLEQAAERIAAAAEAAHAGPDRLVLTARSENFLHGRRDLSDTIARLQAFQEAGADVLYAPGIRDAGDIRSIVDSVDLPVNVLALPGAPTVPELAELGVARVSVGGAFAYAAAGALIAAARELLEQGTYGYWETAGTGAKAARDAFAG